MAVRPELQRTHGRLPRALGRRWLLPLLRLGLWLSGLARGRAVEWVGEGTWSACILGPRPTEGRGPVLLWMHGGGLVMGDARADLVALSALVEATGIPVVSVQYRLAPEHPFPAPLDDCEAAFDWLAAQPWVDPARIAIGGQSAGGGLAAALAQRLRDRGGVQPCFQLLVYAMLDDRSADAPAGSADALFRLWDRPSNRFGWSSYLGDTDPETPTAVPGRTSDLSGLPATWIGVGTADLFHDEDVAYAARLEAAGVAVDLEVVEGAYHGFDVIEWNASVSQAFWASAHRALLAATAPPEPGAGPDW